VWEKRLYVGVGGMERKNATSHQDPILRLGWVSSHPKRILKHDFLDGAMVGVGSLKLNQNNYPKTL
jgi:hypothetical protein